MFFDYLLFFLNMENQNKNENIKLIENRLLNFITNSSEIQNPKGINACCLKTLQKCLNYIFEESKQDKQKLFEIESIIDFLHDELNTGHWSDVPIDLRRNFTIASYVKSLIILKHAEQISYELLRDCLKAVDMGLLLGASLVENDELLTECAKYISTEIIKFREKIPDVPKNENSKRKPEDLSEYLKINATEIDTEDCPSMEHFREEYFIKQVPVKLTGCMNHWPASTKWLDVNYFLKISGDRTVPIEIGSHYTDENWSQKLMPLKEFIKNHYLSESGSNIGYLAQHNLFEQISELKEDIRIPDYCCLSMDYENSMEPDINAWFGPKGTVSPLHYDPKNNFLAQVYGTKQLILFSPNDTEHLYPHDDKLLFNTAQVDPLNPDFEKFPNFSKTKMYKCLLEPGEMIFIPVKWWHHVTALDKSFSVSFWWQ